MVFALLLLGVGHASAWFWGGPPDGDWFDANNWIEEGASHAVPAAGEAIYVDQGSVLITEPGALSGTSTIGIWQTQTGEPVSASVTVTEGASWVIGGEYRPGLTYALIIGDSHGDDSSPDNRNTGVLNINGGTVTAPRTLVGFREISASRVIPVGTITITDGAFNSDELTLGSGDAGTAGSGTLNIHGGTVTTGDSSIGAWSIGNVTITDGVWRVSTVMTLGFVAGTGTLNINGGLVDITRQSAGPGIFLSSIFTPHGSGTIHLNDGVLGTPGIEKGYGEGAVNFNGGILRANYWDNDNYLDKFAPGDVTIEAGGAFIDSNGFNIGFSVALGGVGALTKLGAGTLTLSGASDYLGGTFVNGGVLVANASDALGAGAVSVKNSTLRITEGVTLANSVTLQEGGVLQNSGTLGLADSPGGVAGVAAVSVIGDDATLTNAAAGAAITGGNGGIGIGGGAGGAGVLFIGNGGAVNNGEGATITGGAGGNGSGSDGNGGIGGAGVSLGGDDGIVNNSGSAIAGGKGGNGSGLGSGGSGGAGVALSGNGGILDNGTGTITGGNGGATSFFGNGAGGAGVLLGGNDHTLITGGTISGGLSGGGTIRGNAITVTGGDHTLRLLEGFQFVGDIGVNAGSLTFDQTGYDAVLSTIITGAGAISKSGSAALTLSGANTHAGGTTVSAGTLILSDVGTGSSVLGTGAVRVEKEGVLAGMGTVLGNTAVAGVLAPGNSPGMLHFADGLSLESTAVITMELASPILFDQIIVEGALTWGGTLAISFLDGFAPDDGAQFALFGGSGVVSGSGPGFSDIIFSGGNYEGFFDYNTGVLTVTVVPEPSSVLLLLLAIFAVPAWRRRKAYTT